MVLSKIAANATAAMHLEYSSDNQEVEIYIGGYFLASVSLADISEEAANELFEGNHL